MSLFIFETHPVQYRAPVYQELQRLKPDAFHVFYASDCSVRGHRDRDFQQQMSWDTPLLEGYPFTVLNNERGTPLTTWRSLSGRGIFRLLKTRRPSAVLLTQFSYAYSLAVLASAALLRIPVWIRMEIQDHALRRSPTKSRLRAAIYRVAYRFVSRAFYIGERNREHLLAHGLKPDQLTRSPYCVPTALPNLSHEEKLARRARVRASLGIPAHALVFGFFGKLIPKKNPDLLLRAMLRLPPELRETSRALFVGSGEMQPELEQLAADGHLSARFTGFVNQSQIGDYYLATDQLILPSRFAGETWGLVVNEALHAGCAVIISEAVGCALEFGQWERVRVIPVGDADRCAAAMLDLSKFPRDFDWCSAAMDRYSIPAAAQSLAAAL